MDTSILTMVPATSLLGELLAEWEAAAYQYATDADGIVDYLVLDQELDQNDIYLEDLARELDIFEVFASEVIRGV